jgi:hypothetical protein
LYEIRSMCENMTFLMDIILNLAIVQFLMKKKGDVQ